MQKSVLSKQHLLNRLSKPIVSVSWRWRQSHVFSVVFGSGWIFKKNYKYCLEINVSRKCVKIRVLATLCRIVSKVRKSANNKIKTNNNIEVIQNPNPYVLFLYTNSGVVFNAFNYYYLISIPSFPYLYKYYLCLPFFSLLFIVFIAVYIEFILYITSLSE